MTTWKLSSSIGFVVLLVFIAAVGHRLPLTAALFTSDKICAERHAPRWLVERLGIDCDRLFRERLWKLYERHWAEPKPGPAGGS